MAEFNHKLANGKWDHFMDQTVLGYTSWNDPPRNSLNAIRLKEIDAPEAAAMGVAVEGSKSAWPGETNEAALPAFDVFNQQQRLVDVFNRGSTAFDFTASTDQQWIHLSREKGAVKDWNNMWVSVDWVKAPKGSAAGTVTITGAGGTVVVKVTSFKPDEPTRGDLNGFVEGDGYVSIEAEHCTTNIAAGLNRWTRIPDYGHTLSGMRAEGPVDTETTPGKDAPCLEYEMYLFSTGRVRVEATVGATLNFIHGRGLCYAVSFDDETPQVVTIVPADFNAQNGNREWEESVKYNGRIVRSEHTIGKAGYHTLKVWMVDPGVVLEKIVVDTGGVRPSYLGPPESYHRRPNDLRGTRWPTGIER